MDLFKPIKMSTDTRALLKDKIRVAASLTNHQAGKVTGAVLSVLGEKDERLKSFVKEHEMPLPTKRKRVTKKMDEPPFELEEMNYGVTTERDEFFDNEEIILHLTRRELRLISAPLQGAIKSATNEKINSLRKHMDKPEKVQEMIKDILAVSELSFRIDNIAQK